jgi:hypothetical protein
MKNIKLKPHSYLGKGLPRMAHRQICNLCHRVCRVDFAVSDEHWELGLPKGFWNDLVCLECYTTNADERFVPWCESIKFFPNSLIAEIDMLFEDGQLQINTDICSK